VVSRFKKDTAIYNQLVTHKTPAIARKAFIDSLTAVVKGHQECIAVLKAQISAARSLV
jgi:hypothetical protein